MKFIVLAISMMLLAATARAVDTSPIYKEPDAQSKFHDAQLHVKKLMDAGQYQEAAKYMPLYQTLACEAAEQKAGRSMEEGAAICTRKNSRGDVAGASSSALQQLDRSAGTSSNVLAPGLTVMPRSIPGSSTALDGSTPSLLMFDPRSDPGTSFKRPDPPADAWVGKP
ncbi:hypothetical protein [Nitrosovibrio tenuis]|uniref:DUF4398 domain-containing protein n=1 Tax=Nitrosovibrio tenuis TaxID=1233 RepID=A0A1H7J5T7_9PROT|nr:hypothetical protein [Nitrosovibrio tenuis]SEK68495.1 hypothetical protein SAMN05216387_102362 [Nitrosovibrio tenuis]